MGTWTLSKSIAPSIKVHALCSAWARSRPGYFEVREHLLFRAVDVVGLASGMFVVLILKPPCFQWSKLTNPDGPSTQISWYKAPTAVVGIVFGTYYLDVWVLGLSGQSTEKLEG